MQNKVQGEGEEKEVRIRLIHFDIYDSTSHKKWEKKMREREKRIKKNHAVFAV